MQISSEIIKKHGIKLEEYKKIVSLIGRDPNLLELGTDVAQIGSLNPSHINFALISEKIKFNNDN